MFIEKPFFLDRASYLNIYLVSIKLISIFTRKCTDF